MVGKDNIRKINVKNYMIFYSTDEINCLVQVIAVFYGMSNWQTKIKKIILYGSYARGDYNNSSDIDILVLTDYKPSQFYSVLKKISSMTYDIELDYNVILIPLINNIKNYNDEIDSIPFYANIQKIFDIRVTKSEKLLKIDIIHLFFRIF